MSLENKEINFVFLSFCSHRFQKIRYRCVRVCEGEGRRREKERSKEIKLSSSSSIDRNGCSEGSFVVLKHEISISMHHAVEHVSLRSGCSLWRTDEGHRQIWKNVFPSNWAHSHPQKIQLNPSFFCSIWFLYPNWFEIHVEEGILIG